MNSAPATPWPSFASEIPVPGSSADALLDAAVEQFCEMGVRRTTTDDIAVRAGVNRATLYRHLGPRGKIIGAAYRREAQRAMFRVLGAIPDAGTADARTRIRAIISAGTTEVRGNQLLRRLLHADADETRRALTAQAGPVLELACLALEYLIDEIRSTTPAPRADVADSATVAALLTRMTQSLVLTPDGPLGLGTLEEQHHFADAIVSPLILGT